MDFMGSITMSPASGRQIADDSIMTPTEAAKIVVNLRGHVFEIIAYLLDLGESLDLIFGVKLATEVEGRVDFTNWEFYIHTKINTSKANKGNMSSTQKSLNYMAKLDKCPKDFEGGKIMLKMITDKSDHLPQMLLATCINGEFRLSITNHSNKELVFPENKNIGIADMRPVGYYYMSRTVIQQLLQDRFVFLGDTYDEELLQVHEKDPIEALKEVPRPPLKGPLGTKLNIKPDQTKPEKKEKYITGFKVDIDDKYPWLDKDDPHRNMTDGEIL